MNGKFIVYALIVSLACTVISWGKLLSSGGPGGNTWSNAGSGSTWSSNSGSWGGGGGGHK